jgi:protein-tyrosine phosphatase
MSTQTQLVSPREGVFNEFKSHVEKLKSRIVELEDEIVKKSETLARLERIHQSPVSTTVSLVQEAIHYEQQHPHISLKKNPLLAAFGASTTIKLKPTLTKVASNSVGFPEVEAESSQISEIKPWLFLSGNLVARDLQVIRKNGITRILNAAHTVCPNYFQSETDLHYTSFELIDHPKENIDQYLLNAIDEIEYTREHSEKVLVHCHQGISRSATLVIAYIAWKDDLSIADALAYVKDKRRIIQPNAGFLKQLNSFEHRLKSNGPFGPSLYHVTAHSEDVANLVVKQLFDANRPIIDDDDVFILHEGSPNGDILIRKPLVKDVDAEFLETGIKVAGWMIKYEKAFANSKLVICEYDDDRFAKGLKKLAEVLAKPDGIRRKL